MHVQRLPWGVRDGEREQALGQESRGGGGGGGKTEEGDWKHHDAAHFGLHLFGAFVDLGANLLEIGRELVAVHLEIHRHVVDLDVVAEGEEARDRQEEHQAVLGPRVARVGALGEGREKIHAQRRREAKFASEEEESV